MKIFNMFGLQPKSTKVIMCYCGLYRLLSCIINMLYYYPLPEGYWNDVVHPSFRPSRLSIRSYILIPVCQILMKLSKKVSMNMWMMHIKFRQDPLNNDGAMALCFFQIVILYRNFVHPETYHGTGCPDLWNVVHTYVWIGE